MSLRKGGVLNWISVALMAGVLLNTGCGNNEIQVYEGYAQGTTYNIKCAGPGQTDASAMIDSVLEYVDMAFSTYVGESKISMFNYNEEGVTLDSVELELIALAMQVYKVTEGAFDPTVLPLVNAYGFGHEKDWDEVDLDSFPLDSLMDLVAMEEIAIIGRKMIKGRKEIQMDLNGIAQGYTVDLIAFELGRLGIFNYLVEVGGELRAMGKKPNGDAWKIGIDQPSEEAEGRPLQQIIEVRNLAVATSGNYRKFYEKDGVKYGHTIDPRTGKPVRHHLLSATVLADDCALADALATAFMVMGTEQALALAERVEEVEVYLIYEEEGEYREAFSSRFKELTGI